MFGKEIPSRNLRKKKVGTSQPACPPEDEEEEKKKKKKNNNGMYLSQRAETVDMLDLHMFERGFLSLQVQR